MGKIGKIRQTASHYMQEHIGNPMQTAAPSDFMKIFEAIQAEIERLDSLDCGKDDHIKEVERRVNELKTKLDEITYYPGPKPREDLKDKIYQLEKDIEALKLLCTNIKNVGDVRAINLGKRLEKLEYRLNHLHKTLGIANLEKRVKELEEAIQLGSVTKTVSELTKQIKELNKELESPPERVAQDKNGHDLERGDLVFNTGGARYGIFVREEDCTHNLVRNEDNREVSWLCHLTKFKARPQPEEP